MKPAREEETQHHLNIQQIGLSLCLTISSLIFDQSIIIVPIRCQALLTFTILALVLLRLVRPASSFRSSPSPARRTSSIKMSLPTTTSDAKSLIEEVNAQVIASLHLTPKDLPMYKQSTSIRFDHPDHFASDAIIMARQLLGARMVRVLPNGTRLSGKIVECECYLGVDDAAAHSFQGKRSAKNER